MKAETWVNTAALLGRMNFALALASGKLRGTQVAASSTALANATATPAEALSRSEATLLDGEVSEQTHSTVLKQVQVSDATNGSAKSGNGMRQLPSSAPNLAAITGLLLGSPEFQRR